MGCDADSHTHLDFANSYPKKKGGESGYYMEAKIFGGLPHFIRPKRGDRFSVSLLLNSLSKILTFTKHVLDSQCCAL
jgi:hypothetical protein